MMTRPKERGHGWLSDLIVWGALIAPGIVLNKDGSLQTTYRFRGPDLDSTTVSGLVATMARINNALRRLGSGWALHVEARRRVSNDYPDLIPVPSAAYLIDYERHQAFAESGTKLVTDYYMTFTFLLPEDRSAKASSWLFENKPVIANRQIEEQIQDFRDVVGQVVDLLGTILPMIVPLNDGETLTYLHDCISWSRVQVRPPDETQLFDSFLFDTDVLPGLEPMLGDRWIKILAIQSFPSSTMPALLDRLNSLPFEYRWTSRFLSLDKRDAEAELTRLQRQWFAKRKSLGRLLMEMVSKEESGMVNT
ncbi:MAG: conjugal transfer protein TrbE, partial [Geminicoccaceae bacterium]